ENIGGKETIWMAPMKQWSHGAGFCCPTRPAKECKRIPPVSCSRKQGLMFNQAVRTQRTKGYRTKQAFQVALILAFCIWVLYQIKHSHEKRKYFGETSENNLLDLKHTAIILGRKALIGSSNANEDKDSAITEKGSKGSDGENASQEETDIEKKFESNKKDVTDKVEAMDSAEEKKNGKQNAKDVLLPLNETESSLVTGEGEVGYGIIGFHDENGVPQDGPQLINLVPNGTESGNGTIDVHNQAISRTYNQSYMQNNNKVNKQVDAKSEGRSASKGEIVHMLGAMTDATTDQKTQTDSGAILDKSGRKGASETAQEVRVVLDDSEDFGSYHDNSGVTDLKMLSQTKDEAKSEN
ncbi:hypothetical protein IFM89_008946, partial [Coptis chinensis]